jgi:hypothetical protein
VAVSGEPRDLTLEEHERRAGPAVDAAIRAAAMVYVDYASLPEIQALREAPPDELRSIIVVLLARADAGSRAELEASGEDLMRGWRVGRVLAAVGKRPPFSRGDVALLLQLATRALRFAGIHDNTLDVTLAGQPVAAAEKAVKQGGVGELREPILALADTLGRVRAYGVASATKHRARLLALLSDGTGAETATVVAGPAVQPSLVDPGDSWGQAWRPRLARLSPAQAALFTHCSLTSGVVPSGAWRKRAAELVAHDDARDLVHGMLDDTMVAAANQTFRTYEYDGRTYVEWNPAVGDANAALIRGAMWAAAAVDQPWVDAILLDIGLHFGTSGKANNVARDERLANTAAAALGSRTGSAAIGALGQLKAKVGNRNVSKQIQKALEVAAANAGISPSELLELAVPTHGLDDRGRLEIEVGDHAAIAAIEADDVTLTWRGPDGRETSTVPAAIADRKADVNAVKERVKELRAALGLERGRVEDLFAEDREWTVADWRSRYLEHPLTGTIGRRLIWTALRPGGGQATERRTALPDGDGFVSATGSTIDIRPDDRIRLWHPIDATETEIAAWRTALLDRQLRQPFKQAFREVYVLTPAEEETERFSNRYLGHVLRYPQARALMLARRWGTNFLGPFDGGQNGIAKREFRTHGIRAEFWHDAIENEMAGFMGSVEHCTTDQVRFVQQGRVDELMRLVDVPPIVFSEAMRDVDLFVSVTSVGADFVWQDPVPDRADRIGEYWRGAWELPLTESAATRRDALARLIPGLVIHDRLEITERWLVVRGELRTYRIHLGSGNILMEPADTYLCIVPDRGRAIANEHLFLPFDDDPTLSVILSKAFLLARDTKITDRSIVAQIRKG